MYALLTVADLKRGPTVRDVNLDTLLPDGAFDNNKLLIRLAILLTRNVVRPCRCEFTVDKQNERRRRLQRPLRSIFGPLTPGSAAYRATTG
ncbi:MAG: hypothetical protein ACJA0J_001762 [Bdellovibrionota bacterium]|jgi:hypothetical protein